MVSDQYHVNVAMSTTTDDMAECNAKARDIKESISSPIPSEDVTSVLEYFGITATEKMDNQYTMQAHNRLVIRRLFKSS